MESNWFKNNNKSGKFIQWPILGWIFDPNWENITKLYEKAIKFKEWDIDYLDDRIDIIHNHLKIPNSLVFFHFQAGTDRTGELYAAYALKYLNMDLFEALQFTKDLVGRYSQFENIFMVSWYCWYLIFTQGFSSYECKHPKVDLF